MEHAMGNVPFRPVATGSTTHEAPRAESDIATAATAR